MSNKYELIRSKETGCPICIFDNENQVRVCTFNSSNAGIESEAVKVLDGLNETATLHAQIARMKGALERAEVLCRLVTVRQVIEAGNEAIDAAGLNPYCINEGRAEGHEKIGCYFIEAALQSVAKEGEK